MKKKEPGEDDREYDGRLHRALEDAHTWLQEHALKGPTALVGRVRLMVMVGSDYLAGRYTRLPAASVWAILFALLWVVSPVDVIPDVIPGLGWVDDAFVVAMVFRAIRRDLRRYCRDNSLDPRAFGV
jgi:uncharacterized membrane protein YkvA (DUF1232 family)